MKKLLPLLLLLSFNSFGQIKTSTIGEIWDFNIGDVFHTYYYQTTGTPQPHTYYIRTVIDKKSSASLDRAIYTFEVREKSRDLINPRYNWIFRNYMQVDTINNLSTSLSNSSFYTWAQHNFSAIDSNHFFGRKVNHLVDTFFSQGVWQQVAHFYFIDGIPGMLGIDSARYGSNKLVRKLEYYKKGTEEWGSPLYLGIEEDWIIDQKVLIFPNPTKGEITIKSNNVCLKEIQLLDLHGRLLGNWKVEMEDIKINIIQPKGLYFLKVTTVKGLSTHKILKE